MNRQTLRSLLEQLMRNERSLDSLEELLSQDPVLELDHSTLDLHRELRQGVPEVVFGEGKTVSQIVETMTALHCAGQNVLATRLDENKLQLLGTTLRGKALQIDETARCAYLEEHPVSKQGVGTILVVTAGTSDAPVGAEAAFTARVLGNSVQEIRDVGVAGLHRLLRHLDELRQANVIIAVAGMEGALPSVIGGLVDRPVIAVPTSIGYGAAFGGLAALLGMLNSCASGVVTVNIDNGFGAGYAASLMNRREP